MAKDLLEGLIIHHKPISENNLKRLLLIFDRIYFVEPEENHFLIPEGKHEEIYKKGTQNVRVVSGNYAVFYNGGWYEDQENELLDKFDFAINRGIVKVIDLHFSKFYERNFLPLRYSYDLDTANEKLAKVLYPLLEENTSHELIKGVTRGGTIAPTGQTSRYPRIPDAPKLFDEEDDKKFRYTRQVQSMIGKLNRSLAIAHDYSLIPIFLNRTIFDAFSHKFDTAKSINEPILNKSFYSLREIHLSKLQYLMQNISEVLVPDEVLQRIDIKDLIWARQKTFDEYKRLRKDIAYMVDFLSTDSIDGTSMKEVDDYINKKIIPGYENYKSKFWERIGKVLVIATKFTAAHLGMSLGFVPSLNPYQIGLISTACAITGDELGTYADKKLNLGLARKNAFKNTYSYFLDLESNAVNSF